MPDILASDQININTKSEENTLSKDLASTVKKKVIGDPNRIDLRLNARNS